MHHRMYQHTAFLLSYYVSFIFWECEVLCSGHFICLCSRTACNFITCPKIFPVRTLYSVNSQIYMYSQSYCTYWQCAVIIEIHSSILKRKKWDKLCHFENRHIDFKMEKKLKVEIRIRISPIFIFSVNSIRITIFLYSWIVQ